MKHGYNLPRIMFCVWVHETLNKWYNKHGYGNPKLDFFLPLQAVVYLRSLGCPTFIGLHWARPAVLVAGKGRGECFYIFRFFTFIPFPLSSLFLSFVSSTVFSFSFLPFSGRRHKMTDKGQCNRCPASILRKSTSDRHRPVSYPDGPMTARYRFT